MPDTTAGVLTRLAAASERRAREARARVPERELRLRALDRGPAPALLLDPLGFEVLAEFKRRSPSEGDLGTEVPVSGRVLAYAAGGAAAVSVLTEPDGFGGGLADLEEAVEALAGATRPIPALRKDVLVDPYQVAEAAAAGAGGVLLVVRVLEDARLAEMVEAAEALGLWPLLEAFDADDLARAGLAARRASRPLVGLNVRDLQSMAVDPARAAALACAFPPGIPRVAESGMQGPADAARAARAGYGAALVGTALMRSADPARLVGVLRRAGAEVRAARGGTPCAT